MHFHYHHLPALVVAPGALQSFPVSSLLKGVEPKMATKSSAALGEDSPDMTE
jgi:hypothetical protein